MGQIEEPLLPLAKLTMTLAWTHSLRGFFFENRHALPRVQEQRSLWPLILEAEDVISNPGVLRAFCDRIGMNADKIRTFWGAVAPDDTAGIDATKRVRQSTLVESSGIIAERLPWMLTLRSNLQSGG